MYTRSSLRSVLDLLGVIYETDYSELSTAVSYTLFGIISCCMRAIIYYSVSLCGGRLKIVGS